MAVRDVLVDFVLGVLGVRVADVADLGAEAEEVGNAAGYDGDGQARKCKWRGLAGVWGETYSLVTSIW